tara:strand:- start:25 stop:249 length:225 start_codon:yes stop_codon:yes gene_type:complete
VVEVVVTQHQKLLEQVLDMVVLVVILMLVEMELLEPEVVEVVVDPLLPLELVVMVVQVLYSFITLLLVDKYLKT